MPIQTTCSECQARFSLDDAMLGKKIRCGKCQAVFVAEKAPARRRDEEAVEEITTAPRERSRTNGATGPAARKGAPSGNRRDEEDEDDRPSRQRDEDDRDAPRKGQPAAAKSKVPLLVGVAVACVGVLTAGGIVAALMLRPDDSPQASTQPTTQPPPIPPVVIPPVQPVTPVKPVQPVTPVKPVDPPPPPPPPPVPAPVRSAVDTPPPPVRGAPGELPREAMDAVKRGTVYIRVRNQDGGGASGTGFFGDPQAANIILTNAHVVGMLSPESPRPRSVEVFLNHGEPDEKMFTARVLGVDRISDLAVLDIGVKEGMPKALTVKPADKLRELDKVYVFGFPFGEMLGKEITIRNSTVSSFRHRNGMLEKIQINGGVDPGNSGGPVVDANGYVVGVSVAAITGHMINFAIPGDRVQAILSGRNADLNIGLPYKDGDKIATPIKMDMIDPRNRIKEVGIEVWTGNAPPASKAPPVMTAFGTGPPPPVAMRPGSQTQPPELPGDSKHQRYSLRYAGAAGQGDIHWPALPPEKVYWVQPTWVRDDRQRMWGTASVHTIKDSPMERKDIALHSRYIAGPGVRGLSLEVSNRMRIGSDSDGDIGSLVTKSDFAESVLAGSALRLQYKNVDRNVLQLGKPIPYPIPANVTACMKFMRARLQLDGSGNVGKYGLEFPNTVAAARTLTPALQAELKLFHEPIGLNLAGAMLPLPNKTVKVNESWKATRTFGVQMPAGLGLLPVKARLELTCTYLGVRTTARREEAVIQIVGRVDDDKMAGKATGQMLVDLSSGTVTLVHVKADIDLPPLGLKLEGQVFRVKMRSVLSVRLERSRS